MITWISSGFAFVGHRFLFSSPESRHSRWAHHTISNFFDGNRPCHPADTPTYNSLWTQLIWRSFPRPLTFSNIFRKRTGLSRPFVLIFPIFKFRRKVHGTSTNFLAKSAQKKINRFRKNNSRRRENSNWFIAIFQFPLLEYRSKMTLPTSKRSRHFLARLLLCNDMTSSITVDKTQLCEDK